MPLPDLHIVTFAVPWPAHYGGAIDVWNRLVALKALGVKIHLHCFVYGKFDPQPILKTVAAEVSYYPRVVWPAFLSKNLPYIVASRKAPELLHQLNKDKQPIFFEGIQTTGFADVLGSRKVLLRAHNIEQQYYRELADHSRGVKSLIFSREAMMLREYETRIAKVFEVVFPISPHDEQWFKAKGVKTCLLPPFHGHDQPEITPGRGQYVLYHGDLSLGINQEAVLDLVQHLQTAPDIPVVIAGRSGDKAFEEKLQRLPNIRREPDVSEERMRALVNEAQVIVIHSLHGSGMKLKIFPALYFGRFVVATNNSRTDTELDKAIAYYLPEHTLPVIQKYWNMPFEPTQIAERKHVLDRMPDDTEKAKEILRYL
jgi:hypothetical protein